MPTSSEHASASSAAWNHCSFDSFIFEISITTIIAPIEHFGWACHWIWINKVVKNSRSNPLQIRVCAPLVRLRQQRSRTSGTFGAWQFSSGTNNKKTKCFRIQHPNAPSKWGTWILNNWNFETEWHGAWTTGKTDGEYASWPDHSMMAWPHIGRLPE